MYGFCLTILTEIAEGEKDGMRACVECQVSSVSVCQSKKHLSKNVEVLFIIDTPCITTSSSKKRNVEVTRGVSLLVLVVVFIFNVWFFAE